MKFYWLILAVLTVWRITHLLHGEDGPWDLVVKLRRMAGEGFCGSLLDCFYCLSIWVALPVAAGIGSTWMERLLLWPALSAGAILLERATSRGPSAPAAQFWLEPEEGNDVLWREENNDAPKQRVSAKR